jgi:lysophospholipase L1-like esterase
MDGAVYFTSSRTTPEDGGAGNWRYDAASTATANGGTILAVDGGGAGRFFRLFDGDEIDARWFGAFTSGATALATINSTISYCSTLPLKITLAGQSVTLSAAPTNTYGVPFVNGKILIPTGISSSYTQQNTYTSEINGPMIARENLAAWWKSVTAGTFQNIYLYGDSTVITDGAFPVKPHELFKQALYAAGVNNCLTVNRGVSGTSWGDLNAIPDLAATTKLIIIKYGINDAVLSNNLATMAAAMRSKLTAIRAATNGDFPNLSILLMGPNSTWRPVTGQDAKWYEDLRNLYIQICKEFDCAYFDTYAYLQDTSRAPGLWMDSFEGGQGIHPDPVAVYWIWFEGLKTFVLGDGQWNTQKANQHWNVNFVTLQRFPTDEPQTFPFGLSSWVARQADGWPITAATAAALEVYRQADGNTRQILYTLDTQPRAMVRTGTGLVWTQWTGLRTAVSVFTNSWVNKAGGYADAGYVLLENGMVKLYGVIKNGTSGLAAFTLPSNLRPATAHLFPDGNVGTVTVFSNGTVIPATADNTTVSLDGIMFPASNP